MTDHEGSRVTDERLPMQRYRFRETRETHGNHTERLVRVETDDEGGWIRYSDHQRELAAARALSEIYFNIARDFYSDEEIRRRRDAAIDALKEKGHD